MIKMIKWYQWLALALLILMLVSAFKPSPSFIGKRWVLSSYKRSDGTEKRLKLGGQQHDVKRDNYLTFYNLFNFVEIHTSARHGFYKYTIRNKKRLRMTNPVSPSKYQTMDRRTEFSALSKKDYRSLDLLRSSIYSMKNGQLVLTLTSYYKGNQGDQLIFMEVKDYPRRWFPYLLGQQILMLLDSIGVFSVVIMVLSFSMNLIGFFPTVFVLFVLISLLVWRLIRYIKNKKQQQEYTP